MASAQSVILSPELIYGVRLVTLLAKANVVLRDEFHQYFPREPVKLYKEIKKHDQKLKLLLKQRVLHKSEYNILLPASGKTKSSEFDISLLVFALITICPIQAPVTGWNSPPLPSDQSKGAILIRLRIDRNKILHTYFEYEEKHFTCIWDRIVLALEGLGCDKQELLALKTASLDPSLQTDYERKIEDLKQAVKHIADLEDFLKGVKYNLFSPIPSFVGREKEIMELHQNLITRDTKHIGVVIYGLGGVGKSELARQYCNKFAGSYYKENVIWINAEDESTMTEDFCCIAERISLNTKDEYGKLLSIKTVVNKVYRFFADRPVLFVFDNVENKKELMKFIETNRSTNVSILITSQFTEWSARFIKLRTDVLSQNDAFNLVYQNVEKKYTLTNDKIKQLCERMQYLPLALQQSIAYIKRCSITIDKYLEQFQKYADKILDTNQSDEMYNKTVKTTWNMAFHKLQHESNSQLAITLINFMSYLDGKNIKKELFYEYYDEHLVNGALQLLQRYSLIVITTFHDDLEQTILIHSLLQCVIRIESKEKYLLHFLEMILHPLVSEIDIEHESYGKYWYYQLAYMFHQNISCNVLALKISKYLRQLQIIFSSKGKFNMLYQILVLLEIFQVEKFGHIAIETSRVIAQCLHDMGNYDEALKKYQEIENLLIETIGYKHPYTLLIQQNVAFCLHLKGYSDEALTKFQEVDKLQTEIVGYKHPNTLLTQHCVAHSLLRRGNFEEALNEYQKIEKLQIETDGYKHPNTFTTQNNIAECMLHIGNYNEALIKSQKIETLQIETIGYKHPRTLTTQHIIGTCLKEMGNYKEALIKYKEVDKLQIETIGSKHPNTLTTQESIATCLREKGNYEEAINKYQKVAKLRTETIGYKHQNTLITLNNIAICLQSKGNYHEALHKYQEVEKLLIETIGYKHPHTMTTRHHVAECLFLEENYDEALIKYQEVEKLQIETIGDKDPETLTTQNGIARCWQEKGNYDKALIKYRELEKLQIESVGYKHPDTLTTQHNIAECLLLEENYDKALIKYQEVEKLRIETIGYKDPKTLTTQDGIAGCWQKKGNYDKALTKYRELEKLQTETIGSKHLGTLTTQYNIAQCLHEKGNYDEALNKYQKVEKLLIVIIGFKHAKTLITQNNIAICLQEKGKYEEALTKFNKVEKLQIESVGYKHPNTLKIQHNIAHCLHRKGDYDEALHKYQEVKKLRIETIGSKHPDTLGTQQYIGECLHRKGNYDEALTVYQEVKKLQIETFGYEHPDTLTTERNIALCIFDIWKTVMKR